MGVKFATNAYSTLRTNINTNASSLTVASGHGSRFPTLSASDHFYVTLLDTSGNSEIVRVSARSGDTFTILRGRDGTSARSWSAGARIELRLVAAALNDMNSELSTRIDAAVDPLTLEEVRDEVARFLRVRSKAGTILSETHNDSANTLELDSSLVLSGLSGLTIRKLTQAQYNAISTKDASTLYLISS